MAIAVGVDSQRVSVVREWYAGPTGRRRRRTSTSPCRSPPHACEPRPPPQLAFAVCERYDGRLVADPDALELAVGAEALVLVVERGRSSKQLLELLIAVQKARVVQEKRLEEAAARVGVVGNPAPEEGVGTALLDRRKTSGSEVVGRSRTRTPIAASWAATSDAAPSHRSRHTSVISPRARPSAWPASLKRAPARSGSNFGATRCECPGIAGGSIPPVPAAPACRSSAGPFRLIACASARRTRGSVERRLSRIEAEVPGQHPRRALHDGFVVGNGTAGDCVVEDVVLAAAPPIGGDRRRGH